MGRPTRADTVSIDFPGTFSFIENPDQTVAVLDQLARALRNGASGIIVNQSECKIIDYGAECAFSAIIHESNATKRTNFEGSFPSDLEQRAIVFAAGIPRSIGVDLPELQGFYCFPLQKGTKAKERPARSSQRERVTTEATSYFNSCLKTYGYALTETGLDHLASLLGEVIGNAEEHSGRRKWWIGGYMRRSEEARGDCHITIFSFGKTLCESLQTLPLESPLRLRIEELTRKHSKAGFFKRGSWAEDDLWTLYALQERVSKHNIGIDFGDRGIGTVKMIKFFQALGQHIDPQKPPMMSIVSGRTHILFDNKYSFGKKLGPTGEEQVILAFNADNDIEKKPDPKAITHLENYFPGTMISLRFYLDDEYLKALKETADE